MIDDRFTEGVFFDAHTGDFDSIEYDESTDEVVFEDPHTGEELERVPSEDFTPEDHYRVPDEAIEDPVGVYEDIAEYMFSEMEDRLPIDDGIGFRYAKHHTTVVEE